MDKLRQIKDFVCFLCGVLGGFVVQLLGGWTKDLRTLVLFMIIDFAMGLIVAAVFKNSTKTESGALNSTAGLKGICKKIVMLLMVVIATQADGLMGTNYIRSASIIAFIVNELISIGENAGLMGVKFPTAITNAIDVLSQKAEEKRSDQ
ncbi:phage holin [Lachnospiraceae bacterium KM106-2]|nr:phage holin [Lachnospiraceae bacterium KM106-2]